MQPKLNLSNIIRSSSKNIFLSKDSVKDVVVKFQLWAGDSGEVEIPGDESSHTPQLLLGSNQLRVMCCRKRAAVRGGVLLFSTLGLLFFSFGERIKGQLQISSMSLSLYQRFRFRERRGRQKTNGGEFVNAAGGKEDRV